MLETQKIMAFVATSNPERAKAFYAGVLGLPLVSDDDFASVFAVSGTLIRLQKLPRHVPAAHTVLGWQVDDVNAAVVALAERGVLFERYEGMSQDAVGIWTAPSGAKVAWFKDPDGNVLSLTG